MATWTEENTFTRRTSSIPQGFPFKILNVKNDFSNNKRSIIWTWPKQKGLVFSSPRPQQLKVRKFAGSLFHGNISDVPHVWTHSRHTDIREQARGTEDRALQDGTRPQGCPGQWRWLLGRAGLLFDEGPADSGLTLSHWVTFLFAVYYLLLTSPLGKTRSPFPPSSSICDWRDGLRLWASLPHSRVGRGCLLTPASREPRTTWREGCAAWRGAPCGTQSLAFINSESSVTKDESLWVNTLCSLFLAFQPVENVYVKYAARRSPQYHLKSSSTESG